VSEDFVKLLCLRRLPARLNSEQAAPILGFAAHDVPVLVKASLLKPLGNPQANSTKWFAATEIEKCAADPAWLHRATKKISDFWAAQNRVRRNKHKVTGSQESKEHL
jgi:hypothetical protein